MGRMKGGRALSSGAEKSSVSRLSHTLACSMLLKLHKLPHNYPRGETLREDRQARGWSERGQGRTVCRADRPQEVEGAGPDVGLQVAGTR